MASFKQFRGAAVAFCLSVLLTPCDGAQATPVTFFGEDPNPTHTAPIAHPVSDATQASFFGSLVNPGTETLDGFTSGDTTIVTNFNDGVTATLSGGEIFEFEYFGSFAISSPNYYLTRTSAFAISFSSPVSAFGFYATDIGDYGGQLSLTLTDIANQTTTVAVPALEGANGSSPENGSVLYFGFYDTVTTYKSVTFSNSTTSDQFGFDDFTVGTAQQVGPVTTPEPATMALVGVGLIGALAMRAARRG